MPPPDGIPIEPDPSLKPPCNPALSVTSDRSALIIRDPAVLSRFPLSRVLTQLITRAKAGATITPEQLLQRLFDTENTTAGGQFPDNLHCDSPKNPAFQNAAPAACPRAEGALAKSTGLLVPGDPDYFAPIALVNRFDLTPRTATTCGEYRIVYAKWSGRTDPNNRVFLIFEGSLPNPHGDVFGCRPVAFTWANLDNERDPEKIGAALEAFYFNGISGFSPVVTPENFGLGAATSSSYYATQGQVRLSQGMEAPWEMRELQMAMGDPSQGGPGIFFRPVTVKNSLVSRLFDPTVSTPMAGWLRQDFPTATPELGANRLDKIRFVLGGDFNAGESAISGPAGAGYAEATANGDSSAFLGAIAKNIDDAGVNKACPPEDPITATDILHRAAIESCAGCHAPENVLGPTRRLGCGLTFPESLGTAHINENGDLSPALAGVFLPRRAEVMTTFLQACDVKAIQDNLVPTLFSSGIPPVQ